MPQESKFLEAKSKPVTGRGSLGVLRRSLEEAGGVIRLACVANPVGARTPRNSRSISINQETSDGAGNRQKTLGGFWWVTEEISRESRRLMAAESAGWLPGFEVTN
ncbi:aspartate aminotransferase [Aspergillus luchuensis]|uniref:Aspartate aminotransferase n=1 Tax=Aspergillus kawachii TaxID=1069201 RepID=A0A146FT09_ASPKA|nr:aspartate aminotransferase [Aspergillus luchuensis]